MIKSITLKEGRAFKLFGGRTFNFTPGLNILWGDSGIGKSTIIDTISVNAASKNKTPLKEESMLQGWSSPQLFDPNENFINTLWNTKTSEWSTALVILLDRVNTWVDHDYISIRTNYKWENFPISTFDSLSDIIINMDEDKKPPIWLKRFLDSEKKIKKLISDYNIIEPQTYKDIINTYIKRFYPEYAINDLKWDQSPTFHIDFMDRKSIKMKKSSGEKLFKIIMGKLNKIKPLKPSDFKLKSQSTLVGHMGKTKRDDFIKQKNLDSIKKKQY